MLGNLSTNDTQSLHPAAGHPSAPFPFGTSAQAARIRAFDWAATSLGPLETWPPSLTSAVNLVLQSTVPMTILWGPQGIMLYNDSYAVVAGSRHPGILGMPVLEAWPEVAAFSRIVLDAGLRGETLTYRDQHMVLSRTGVPEDTWLDLTYSPILDERGTPMGVLAIVIETTNLVLADRSRAEIEQRLQLALDAAGMIGVWDYHISSDTLYADSRVATMGGLDPAQAARGVALATFLTQVHPADRARVASAVKQTTVAQNSFSEEYRLLGDTAGRWVYARGKLITDTNGQPTRLLAMVMDITAQKRTEEALRVSQEELQLITDEIPELVSYLDRSLTYRFVNRAYEEWFGLPRDRILGRTMREILGEETFADRLPSIERALAGEHVRREAVVESDGRRRDVELRIFPRRDNDGHIQGIYGFVLDISDRKRTEAILRRSSEGLAHQIQKRTRERDRIWTLSQDPFLITDQDGRWLSASPAWSALLGWPQGEFLGRTSEWMEHPDDRDKTRLEVHHLTGGATTMRFENRFRHQDGSYRWFSWTVVPYEDLLYCVARDITAEKFRQSELERTQAQLRQAQKMEAVGQLTGGIAHDFNNLLTGIIGGLDLIQRRLAAGRLERLDRYIATATSSAQRAAALTHRLLAFSRQQSLDVQPIDVNGLISSLEDLLRRTMGAAIMFETSLAAEVWPALTDANQLENALLNLCINARDAMPEGGRLTVETANSQLDETYARDTGDLAPGDFIMISVSDTGVGMPPDVIERAFDPFFTTKPMGQGTGLGLSMIYGFVNQSGGHIRIYSEVGSGTTVKLYLPRQHAAGEAAAVAPADEQPRAAHGEAVLVVEDDPAVRMVVVDALHDLGYSALEASDSTSAISQLASELRIDLLITDIGLPDINGRRLAELARQTRPNLPVLFISGYAEGAAIRNGLLEAGMDMIGKPFAVTALAAKIRAILRPE